MSEHPVHVCRTETPEGEKNYLTLLPPHHITLARGLVPEAIIGVLLRPLAAGEPITPAVFARNRVFADFLHEVIARRAPTLAGFQAEARRVGDGWVYVIDLRTPTPQGSVPLEDIFGGFRVAGGVVVSGSYQRSPAHKILSAGGFFKLDPELFQCLMRELMERADTGARQ